MSGSGIWDSLNQAASMGAKMLGQATNDNTGVVIRENDILCSGSLEKCSKFLATWKKRHMVLTKDYLCSFEHEGQLSNPTEVLKLKECQTVKSSEDDANTITVQTPERTFQLRAENPQEKERWIGAIGRAMIKQSSLIGDDC